MRTLLDQVADAEQLSRLTVEFLKRGRYPETRELAFAMERCRRASEIIGSSPHVEYKESCNSPLCPTCALAKQRRLYARLLGVTEWLNKNHPGIDATSLSLTTRTVFESDFLADLERFKRHASRFFKKFRHRGCLCAIEVKVREGGGIGFHCHSIVLTDGNSWETAMLRNRSSLCTLWRKNCRLDYIPSATGEPINLKARKQVAGNGYYLRKPMEFEPEDPDLVAAVALLFKFKTRIRAAGDLLRPAFAAADANYKASRPSTPHPPRRRPLDPSPPYRPVPAQPASTGQKPPPSPLQAEAPSAVEVDRSARSRPPFTPGSSLLAQAAKEGEEFRRLREQEQQREAEFQRLLKMSEDARLLERIRNWGRNRY